MEPAFAPRKLDLLLHLVANLPHPVVLRGPVGAGKTQLLRQFQAHAHSNWLTCYLPAGPNLTFDHVVEEALRLLRKPIEGYGSGYAEALEEQLGEMERQGRCLVFLLDNAGTLMPGLLESLVRYVSLQPPLKLVCALTPDDFAAKTLTDPAAFKTAQVLPLAPEPEFGEALVPMVVAPPPEVHPAPVARRTGWVYALSALAVAGLLAVGTVVPRDWLAILKDRLGGPTGAGSEATSAPEVASAPPAVVGAGGDQAAPPEPEAIKIEPPAPASAETPVAPPGNEPPPPVAQAEAVGPALPSVAAPESAVVPTPPAATVVPAQPEAPTPAPPPAAATEPVPVPAPPTPVPEAPATAAPVPVAPSPVPTPVAAATKPAVPQGKPNTLAELRDAAWLLQQDPKGFTLQLITVSQPARLNGFVRGFPPSDQIAMYKTTRPAGDLYIVVYGIYPSFGAALAAAAELPSRQGRPVPRPLKAIQQEIHNTRARERAPESDNPNE